MIRPGVAAPNLAPRMGLEVVRERAGVEYRELETRSLVNRCDSPRVPFEWTVNPYRGCAFGCRYCYATYTHEYLGLDANGGFHSTIYAKTGGLDEGARRLALAVRREERVALGTATDPYQPGEADLRITRRFLERAAQLRGLRLGITTKGAIILRDLDLLQRIHERSVSRSRSPSRHCTPTSSAGSSPGRRRHWSASRSSGAWPRRAFASASPSPPSSLALPTAKTISTRSSARRRRRG